MNEKSQDSYPITISPENALVANTFLENSCDIQVTARKLNMSAHQVASIIDEKTTANYIRTIMLNTSFGKMDKIAEQMEEIIENKMQELREMELTSSKDIAELLTALSKMLESKAKLVQSQADSSPKNQKNQQINIYSADTGYGRLMESIVKGD